MDFKNILLVIGILWIIQSILTYFQIKNYNEVSNKLATKGKLVVGTKKGYFSSGAILIMAVDSNYKIIDCMVLNGITVLARFRRLEELINRNLLDETNKMLLSNPIKQAYEKAIANISLFNEKD
ncbi:MAG: transcriptional regulator GutM [Thermoanaerobacter sp.]|jgi:glucitol operon activator protein|nr:transcriptional regulator GutM [Thermoanaerobacter sp.]